MYRIRAPKSNFLGQGPFFSSESLSRSGMGALSLKFKIIKKSLGFTELSTEGSMFYIDNIEAEKQYFGSGSLPTFLLVSHLDPDPDQSKERKQWPN